MIASDFPLWRRIVLGAAAAASASIPWTRLPSRKRSTTWLAIRSWRAMGQNGRRAILETYNWPTESAKLIALYADL
ncbi:hypothetical protein LP419_02935 [Massilia sp. H-1]|nr:hypothetical protein LP419_02935 [Massilia sp. H-1]